MCATTAVGNGATLQPGVDDHCDTALAHYCLDTHTRDLLRKGQSVEKLALVQAW
jgi:alkylhydroperoxidase family enzyme